MRTEEQHLVYPWTHATRQLPVLVPTSWTFTHLGDFVLLETMEVLSIPESAAALRASIHLIRGSFLYLRFQPSVLLPSRPFLSPPDGVDDLSSNKKSAAGEAVVPFAQNFGLQYDVLENE